MLVYPKYSGSSVFPFSEMKYDDPIFEFDARDFNRWKLNEKKVIKSWQSK